MISHDIWSQLKSMIILRTAQISETIFSFCEWCSTSCIWSLFKSSLKTEKIVSENADREINVHLLDSKSKLFKWICTSSKSVLPDFFFCKKHYGFHQLQICITEKDSEYHNKSEHLFLSGSTKQLKKEIYNSKTKKSVKEALINMHYLQSWNDVNFRISKLVISGLLLWDYKDAAYSRSLDRTWELGYNTYLSDQRG